MATNKDRKEEWLPQNRRTEGTWKEATEKKGYNGRKEGKFIQKTQHGRQEENRWVRESEMEIVE